MLEASLESLFLCRLVFCSNRAKEDEKIKVKKRNCFLLAASEIPEILGNFDIIRVLILALLR